jgi:hypothetical protein
VYTRVNPPASAPKLFQQAFPLCYGPFWPPVHEEPDRVKQWRCAMAGKLCARGLLCFILCAVMYPAPARASVMTPPAPYRAKDFSLIYARGLFHIFYIRHDTSVIDDSTERDFGHATSSDLMIWTQSTPVLPVRPSNWDNWHVWAPSIIAVSDSFIMFYTGVTNGPGFNLYQRMGIATSHDLTNWIRRDAPIFDCTQPTWDVCDPLNAATSFRDPFVMPDPANPGTDVMYYSANLSSDPAQMVAGLASSTYPFATWTDVMPMLNTDIPQSFSQKIESPHVFSHVFPTADTLWYLFYTTNSGHPINFETSTNPTGDSTFWSPQVHLNNEVPTAGTDTWSASEELSVPHHDYFAAANMANNGVEIRELVWDTKPHFHFMEPTTDAVESDGPSIARGWTISLARSDPAASTWTLRLAGGKSENVSLNIIDVAGHRIRSLLQDSAVGGQTDIRWNGKDERGDQVRTGVYFAVLNTHEGIAAARVAVLR